MKHLITLSVVCFSLFLCTCTDRAERGNRHQHTTTIQWRGVDRTGIFHETGLKTSWSENEPQLLWYFDGLGEGHSSPAISNGKIYVTGMIDDSGYLFVFDLNGNLLHQVFYSAEWNRNYHGTRGTPTISDGKIYIMSGMGDLICFNQRTLEVIWQRNILADFGAQNIMWGITESPLIIGDKIIATPGGTEHNVVALNRYTGELVWSSPGVGERASYTSPLYIGTQEVPLIVTLTAQHIIGLEAATGNVLWYHESRNTWNINVNTPLYHSDMLLWTSVDKGATMLRLTNGGRNVEQVWHIPEFDSMMGAFVRVGNYIYGSSSGETHRDWFCVHWYTGEIMWRTQGVGVGAIIASDGMLYIYSDRGEMALVNATPEKLDIAGRFEITLGTDQHWAHPIIYNGVLYVRRGNTLMAYGIR